ncbi:MAG: plasmid recombination protein [Allgaiera sp.]|jgi:hypothetical protein|nr:plasmid recombination protein [Allgaiera sp.]
MKDLTLDTHAPLTVGAHLSSAANPRAVLVRLEARSMSKAKGTRAHDFRLGNKIPKYVDRSRSHLNRTLIPLRPLFQIRDENARLRERAGRQRAMKSNAAVVSAALLAFGTEAAKLFETLPPETQDAAFLALAQAIAARLDTALESLVVHRDETALHAHFILRGYTETGLALSDTMKAGTTSELQNIAAEVMARFHPGIERGHRKRDRLAAGAAYSDTLHRSVRQLHQDLPAEIEARQIEVRELQAEKAELAASNEAEIAHLAKLQARVDLFEREEKRLRAYEARLAKREEETARQRSEAEKMTRLARERLEAAERMHVAFETARAGLESVVGEIDAGTMRVNENGKIILNNHAPLHAMPKTLLDGLMPSTIRLVRLIDETDKQAAGLDRMMSRVKEFLGRDDLTQDARRDAEDLWRDWGPL